MTSLNKAYPRSRLQGIRDESGRAVEREPIPLPTNLPHVFTFAERGPSIPHVGVGANLQNIYGQPIFDVRSNFATHQTRLLEIFNAAGNQTMVQRVFPSDIPPRSTLVLWADVLKCPVPAYETDENGNIVYDENNDPVLSDTAVVDGMVVKWVVEEAPKLNKDGEIITDSMTGEEAIPVENAIGQLNPQIEGGDQTYTGGTDPIISDRIPVKELEVQHLGSYGKNIGFRMWAPHEDSSVSLDTDTVMDQLAYLFRVQFVERRDKNSSANTIETLLGGQYVDFAFKEGAINETTDSELFVDEVVLSSYEDTDNPDFPPVYGPMGRLHVYHDNLQDILKDAYDLEIQDNQELPVADDPEEDHPEYVMNVLSGHDHRGEPYWRIRMVSPSSDGNFTDHDAGDDTAITLTEQSTHWCFGGGDGTLSNEEFDAAVFNEMANYGDLENKYLDRLRYPHTSFWDTGFKMETKTDAWFTPIAKRKDVFVVTTPFVAGEEQGLTAAEEQSSAAALRAAARVFPESEIYGTSTCRAIIIAQSGKMIGSQVKDRAPLVYEFAQKVANYMGAGDGRWRPSMAFDRPENNKVEMFRDVNNVWKPERARAQDWDNGMVWAQSYDMKSLFWPAFQTVYDDDTSVLNSAATMMVAVECQKIADRVWRDLTGISHLTNDQFVERSDSLIEAEARNKFGNRVVIEPETFLSGGDETRGYSWSARINLYANNMRTVGTFTVVARRMEDLEG